MQRSLDPIKVKLLYNSDMRGIKILLNALLAVRQASSYCDTAYECVGQSYSGNQATCSGFSSGSASSMIETTSHMYCCGSYACYNSSLMRAFNDSDIICDGLKSCNFVESMRGFGFFFCYFWFVVIFL